MIQTDCVRSSLTRHSDFSSGSRDTHVKRPLKCYDLIAYLKNHNTPHFCHDSDITYLRTVCSLCIVKMCHLSAIHLSICVIFQQGANIVYLFVVWRWLKVYTLCSLCIVKMCHLSAIHLSRWVVFQQGANIVYLFVVWQVCAQVNLIWIQPN